MKTLGLKLFVPALLLFALSATAQTKVEAVEIINKINEGTPVEYRNAEITGDLDLTNLKEQQQQSSTESSNVFFANAVKATLRFTNCTFLGKVIATRHGQDDTKNIYYANFTEPLLFKNCTFKEEMIFRHAAFGKDASFEGSKFLAGVDFLHTNFTAGSVFTATTFARPAYFRHTAFARKVDFSKAVFQQGIDCTHTVFSKGVNFEKVTFEEPANFNHTEFTSPVQWSGAVFSRGFVAQHPQLDGENYAFEAATKTGKGSK